VPAHAYQAIKLRGLPYTVKPEDIISFFKGYDVQDEVKIGKTSDNSKTGEGAVLFSTEEECKRAYLN
jgi:hypothetical protein